MEMQHVVPMSEPVETVLGALGVNLPDGTASGGIAARLRQYCQRADVEVQTNADGSQRLRLAGPYDQVVLTPQQEVVVVRTQHGRHEIDFDDNTVCATTTAKAANELTKLRFWRAVQAGLESIRAVGLPDKPGTLEQWLEEHADQAIKLRRQAAILGLAAEKTHQFSALDFEPALLEESRQRMAAMSRAIAFYYAAQLLRSTMIAETSRRLTEKSHRDSESRRLYFVRRKQTYTRAAEYYDKAARLFAHGDAKVLARESAEMAQVCAEAAGEPPADEASSSAPLVKGFEESRARDRYNEARKLIRPNDLTLCNTVRAINALSDPARQQYLKQWLANHLADVSRCLKTPQEVRLLVEKVERLRDAVTADTCIAESDLVRIKQLIGRIHGTATALQSPMLP